MNVVLYTIYYYMCVYKIYKYNVIMPLIADFWLCYAIFACDDNFSLSLLIVIYRHTFFCFLNKNGENYIVRQILRDKKCQKVP